MQIDHTVDISDILSWLDDYDSRLGEATGKRMRQHQREAVLECAQRLRPVYNEWVKDGGAGVVEEIETIDVSQFHTKKEKDEHGKHIRSLSNRMGYLLAHCMGLGKCSLPSTRIFAQDQLISLENLWQDFASEKQEFDGEGFWATPQSPLYVNAIDGSGKMVRARVTRLYRQYIKAPVRTLKLADGSCITTTLTHPFLSQNGWSSEIGKYVCVPGKIVVEGNRIDSRIVELMAWQVSDGHEQSNTAFITQKDTKVLDHINDLLISLGYLPGNIVQHHTQRAPMLRINKNPAYKATLLQMGFPWGTKSANRQVPTAVMSADDAAVKVFLRTVFDAEATISPTSRMIEFCSASERMTKEIALLLRRFGIWMRIKTKTVTIQRGPTVYWRGLIGGPSLRRFQEQINFGYSYKIKRLDQACEAHPNTNNETIPLRDILCPVWEYTSIPHRDLGVRGQVSLRGNQDFSFDSALRVVHALDSILKGIPVHYEYADKKYNPDPQTIATTWAKVDKHRDLLKATLVRVQAILNREVFYCRVVSNQVHDYEGWVYDLEIEDHHNFVAEGILCHNTASSLVIMEMMVRFFPHLTHDEKGDRLVNLAIVPNSLKGVWETEFAKWLIDRDPDMDLFIVDSEVKKAKRDLEIAAFLRPFLVVISYDTLRVRLDLVKKYRWGVVLADEVNWVKNPTAQRTRAIWQVPSRFRLGMGGTPITNRPNDWWSSLAWLQGYTIWIADRKNDGQKVPLRRSQTWDSYTKFVETYTYASNWGSVVGGQNLSPQSCTLCEKSCLFRCPWRYDPIGERITHCSTCEVEIAPECGECTRPLHARTLHHVMNRRRFEDCIDMDPFTVIDRVHPLTNTQREWYEQIREGLIQWVDREKNWQGFRIANVLTQWLYFMECCVDLRQFQQAIYNRAGKGDNVLTLAGIKGDILAKLADKEISGKRNELFDLLRDEIDLSQDKILIFTAFDVTARALTKDLARYNPVLIDGEANQRKETKARVERFQTDPATRILLGTSAAFEGLTLTAANWVILWGFVDWSPMKVLQAIKRSHRMGQEKPVRVIKLLAEDTIETKLLWKLIEKMSDFDQAMDGGAIDRTGTFRLSGKRDILSVV